MHKTNLATKRMNEIHEKRNSRRILAVCRVLDLQGKFLGFTLDLSYTGIKIIINSDFPQDKEFEIILSLGRDYQDLIPDVVIKIEQVWRFSHSEEFDQIGGKIINTETKDVLESFISYCDEIEKQKYS